MNSTISCKRIHLDFNDHVDIDYNEVPDVNSQYYEARIAQLMNLASSRYSHILVYADREHFSNLEYLTGYDPRFEEALLILSQDRSPLLVVSPEGIGASASMPLQVEKIAFAPFGIPGQPIVDSPTLDEIFTKVGINPGSKVGVAGWKLFSPAYYPDSFDRQIDIPYFIMEALQKVALIENISNANDLFIDNEYGVRLNLDLRDIILAEIAGTKVSRSVSHALRNLKPGMSEIAASSLLLLDGEPTVAHPVMNFGIDRYGSGLLSPNYKTVLHYGDPIGVGTNMRRGLCHKTAVYCNENDLPDSFEGIVENLYIPYFQAMSTWYETVKIGATADEVYSTVEQSFGSYQKFGVVLNPGHMIATEECTNSPFNKGADTILRSGMGIQCDIAAEVKSPHAVVHIEDGIILADQEMRDAIKAAAPKAFERIENRKAFMRNTLGINIDDSVLPLSDLQGMLFPFAADPEIVLVNER